MKNILLMVPRLNMGGAETYTYQLAHLLRGQNYKVYIASGGGYLAKQLKKEGFTTFFLPMRFSTTLSAFCLQFIIKKYHIQLIHANSAAAGITAVKYIRKYGTIPIIFTAHGVATDKDATYLKDCTQIIAVSDYLRQQLISQSIPQEKITRIYSGIDTLKIDPQKVTNLDRNTLNIPPDAFTMILVARIRNLTNKGHLTILNILSQYSFAKDWHLIVLGEGSGYYKLKNTVKKLNLQQRVHLLGQQNDVPPYTKLADVVISPSRFETFGLALAEGMAMEKPGVAFKVGGVSEIIPTPTTGLLVDYPNEEDFAHALQTLAANPKLRSQMGKAARQDICQRFSVSNMLQEILTIYGKALKK